MEITRYIINGKMFENATEAEKYASENNAEVSTIKVLLTSDEVADAHKRFVTSWMQDEAASQIDKDVSEDDLREIALDAYDIYCEGDGLTEYEAVETAVNNYYRRLLQLENAGYGNGHASYMVCGVRRHTVGGANCA